MFDCHVFSLTFCNGQGCRHKKSQELVCHIFWEKVDNKISVFRLGVGAEK